MDQVIYRQIRPLRSNFKSMKELGLVRHLGLEHSFESQLGLRAING